METNNRGCLRGLPRALEDSSTEAYPRHAERASAHTGWNPEGATDSVFRANWPGRVKKTERNADRQVGLEGYLVGPGGPIAIQGVAPR